MTDRELLELAAKAAGYMNVFACDAAGVELESWWRPLDDDGDAFRLMVGLKLDVMFFNGFEEIHAEDGNYMQDSVIENYSDDMRASVRLAIVRAAAEIGRMKND